MLGCVKNTRNSLISQKFNIQKVFFSRLVTSKERNDKFYLQQIVEGTKISDFNFRQKKRYFINFTMMGVTNSTREEI